MKKSRSTILIICILITIQGHSQHLSNPSFEGVPSIASTPDDWAPFNATSTPDTESGENGLIAPSDGSSYIILVSRGPESSIPNTFEGCQTELISELQNGICYDLNIDLASSDDLFYCSSEGITSYSEEAILKIYGSKSKTDKGDLLLETSGIENTNWLTYSFVIKATDDYSYLILEIGLSQQSFGNGNILIDNLSITEQSISPKLVFENSFTNEDLPISLIASHGIEYNWSPSEGLSCTDCQNPDAIIDISSTFYCNIIDENGCESNEMFIIHIQDENLSQDLFIPNVFTPNNDNINDRFVIQGLPPYSSILIFDKYGKQVYIKDNYSNEWNGKDMNNIDLPEGPYWYILVTPGLSGKYKGEVYLKRSL